MSSTALTNVDKKFWQPQDPIIQKISDLIPEGSCVLDVGPGRFPFPRATHFIDVKGDLPNIKKDQLIVADFNDKPLPYGDKSFDFVYCRSTIEDLQNPQNLLREMERVGKAGYIETPSPIAELARGIDWASPPFRGYHHHHSIVWAHEGELRLVHKYPILEYFRFSEEDIIAWLREGPICWNTHFLWNDKINWVYRTDYDVTQDYAPMLKSAMDQAKINSGMFWMGLSNKEIKQTIGSLAAA